jgi:hypothetical protein
MSNFFFLRIFRTLVSIGLRWSKLSQVVSSGLSYACSVVGGGQTWSNFSSGSEWTEALRTWLNFMTYP